MNQTENRDILVLDDQKCIEEYGFPSKKVALIRDTFCKGCTVEQMETFFHVCKHTGLDPFLKQIYAIVRNCKQKDGSSKPTLTIQTSIDGYRLIAERTGRYSPGKEPSYTYDETIAEGVKYKKLVSATAYIKKMTKDGTWHEVSASAQFKEYVPSYQNDFWTTKQHIMLSKCAEALALRKAFPAELSAIYTKEEMDQADNTQQFDVNSSKTQTYIDVTPKSAEIIPIEPLISANQLLVLQEMFSQIDMKYQNPMIRRLEEQFKTKELAQLAEIHYLEVKAMFDKMIKYQEDERKKNENN